MWKSRKRKKPTTSIRGNGINKSAQKRKHSRHKNFYEENEESKDASASENKKM